MHTPPTSTKHPLRFVSDSEDELTYSSSDEVEAQVIDVDVFVAESPTASVSGRPVVHEPVLVAAVRDAVHAEDLNGLKELLCDEDQRGLLNIPQFNAMDQALKMWLRDKNNSFIPRVVSFLREKGACPNAMRADAKFWSDQMLKEAQQRVAVAKLLSF